MLDPRLRRLLDDLANAIRDVRPGEEKQTLVDRFLALIAHLESADQIEKGS
jgi:hypothetical protein